MQAQESDSGAGRNARFIRQCEGRPFIPPLHWNKLASPDEFSGIGKYIASGAPIVPATLTS